MKLSFIISIAFLLTFAQCGFSETLQESLQDAIIKGDLKAVQQLLDKNPEYVDVTIGVAVKERTAYEISALCFALRNNQPEIAELLLTAGADPTVNTDDRNLLCYAARGGYTDLIPLLIKRGVDPNVDPNIEGQNTFGMPRLPLSQVKDIKTAQALIDNGADVNARASNGQTPLHYLAIYGSNDVISFLIEHGADVNSKDNRGYTPLHTASQYCRTEKVQLFIDNGADVNALNNNGKNALKQTIEWQAFSRFGLNKQSYYETLRLLIKNGSEADVGDLVLTGDLAGVKEKLKNDPELIHADQFRRNPLLVIAIAHGHDDIVKYLIEQGADIHITGSNNFPLLHTAARAGNPETVKLLLNEGLNVNQKGVRGELPLHWASAGKVPLPWNPTTANSDPDQNKEKYDQTAQILINAGSELDTKTTQPSMTMATDIEGGKPIDQVSHYLHNMEVGGPNSQVQVMAPPDLAFDVGDTPLHSAARWGRIDIVNTLIKAGAQIDPENALNQTPLHYAVVYQHTDVVKALLKAGADPRIKTNKGIDAFQFAKTVNDSTIISLLTNFGM